MNAQLQLELVESTAPREAVEVVSPGDARRFAMSVWALHDGLWGRLCPVAKLYGVARNGSGRWCSWSLAVGASQDRSA